MTIMMMMHWWALTHCEENGSHLSKGAATIWSIIHLAAGIPRITLSFLIRANIIYITLTIFRFQHWLVFREIRHVSKLSRGKGECWHRGTTLLEYIKKVVKKNNGTHKEMLWTSLLYIVWPSPLMRLKCSNRYQMCGNKWSPEHKSFT